MKIKVENLCKSFVDAGGGLRIIENLNIEFEGAGSIAIVGKSGIGKSTLLQILGGLDKPSSGSVFYDDQDICRLSTDDLSRFRGKHVGFIFQFHNLLPEFSALENVAMPLIIGGFSEKEALHEAAEILERVGLAERFDHRPSQLSGGEQQRVAIARALVSKPRVILADEPTGNLDYRTANEVQAILLEISKSVGSTLIVVTHNSDLAASMKYVYEMQPGGELLDKTA